MRAAALLLAVALLPSAAAFALGAEKIVERGLVIGGDVVFEMPLSFDAAGHFYAKLLATPGNAVNGGAGPNGTWSVSYVLLRADGAREEMGSFANSSLSRLVPVAAGETATFEATVHIPADAAEGGPAQSVFVALAWRSTEASAAPGSASGAQMDEARAITLLLTDALLPPAASTDAETDVPAVSAIDTDEPASPRAQVAVQQALPTWFLVGALLVGVALVATTGVAAAALVALARRSGRTAHRVPVRLEPSEPEEPRVATFERVR